MQKQFTINLVQLIKLYDSETYILWTYTEKMEHFLPL